MSVFVVVPNIEPNRFFSDSLKLLVLQRQVHAAHLCISVVTGQSCHADGGNAAPGIHTVPIVFDHTGQAQAVGQTLFEGINKVLEGTLAQHINAVHHHIHGIGDQNFRV